MTTQQKQNNLSPDFTTMIVNEDGVIVTALAEPEHKLAVCYICTLKTGEICREVKMDLRLSDGDYVITYINL